MNLRVLVALVGIVLSLIRAVGVANTYVAEPIKADKAKLVGEWETIPSSEESFFYYMVLLSNEDGFLVQPRQGAHPGDEPFFGRLVASEFKGTHFKLSFRKLPNQEVGSDDAVEIEGELRGIEDRAMGLKGTSTRHSGEEKKVMPLRMIKGEYIQGFADAIKSAKERIAQEQKPGPNVSDEAAVEFLRKQEVITDKVRVLSKQWDETLRQWIVTLQNPDKKTYKVRVNVPAQDFHYLDER